MVIRARSGLTGWLLEELMPPLFQYRASRPDNGCRRGEVGVAEGDAVRLRGCSW